MKIREGYVINRLGDGYVVVTVGEACKDFNGLIRLNNAGAFLWKSIQCGDNTKEKLIGTMLDYYEGLDEATAGADVEEFLKNVGFALED